MRPEHELEVLALELGGFALLGVAFGGLFVASTLPYASLRLTQRPTTALTTAPEAAGG